MANKPYPLIDQVLAERGKDALLMPDSETSVVRRRFLHGETISSAEPGTPKSAINKAVGDLKRCGYTFESKLAPSRGVGMGRPSVLHRVTNRDHVPTSVAPQITPKASDDGNTNADKIRNALKQGVTVDTAWCVAHGIAPAQLSHAALTVEGVVRVSRGAYRLDVSGASADTAKTGLATLVREELISGRAVSAAFAEAHGFTRDQLHKAISNVQNSKLKNPIKVQRLTNGSYVLKGKPPKSSALARHDGGRLDHLLDAPAFDLATLPALGGGLQVRGLMLDDDDSVRIALRNGTSSWVARIEGVVAP